MTVQIYEGPVSELEEITGKQYQHMKTERGLLRIEAYVNLSQVNPETPIEMMKTLRERMQSRKA